MALLMENFVVRMDSFLSAFWRIFKPKSGMTLKRGETTDNVDSYFRLIVHGLHISGIYCNPKVYKKRKFLQIVHLIYCSFISLFFLLFALLFFWIPSQQIKWSSKIMTAISLEINLLSGSAYTTLCFYYMPKYFPPFLDELKQFYRDQKKSPKTSSKQKKFILLSYFVLAFVPPVIVSLFVALYNHPSSLIHQLWHLWIAYFSNNYTLLDFVEISITLLLSIWTLQSGFSFILYTTICHLLGNEFAHLDQDIRSTFVMDPSIAEVSLEKARKLHGYLCRLLVSAKFVSIYALCSFASSMPGICVSLYSVIHQALQPEDLLVLLVLQVGQVFQMIAIIVVGIKLNRKIHAPSETLHEEDYKTLPDRALHTISIFLSKLAANSYGIPVGGLFVIDNSSILMMAGTLLTYTVVVLQLNLSIVPQDLCLVRDTSQSTYYTQTY